MLNESPITYKTSTHRTSSPEKTLEKISKIRELEARTKEYKLVFDKDGKEVNIHFDTTIEKTDNDNIFIKFENNKYGVIDKEGKTLIDCEYDLLQIIRNTNAYQAVNFETNMTYIFNNKLEKIIEIPNATINVEDEKIVVYNDEINYKLDNNGNIIVDN